MTQDSFETLWNFRFEEIADAYIPGTLDFLEQHRSKLYEEISLIEDTINQDWEKKRMVAFKIDTKDWQELMKQGIEQFERERMHVPEGAKSVSPATKPKPKSSEPETPHRKTFFEVFQEMKAKENF